MRVRRTAALGIVVLVGAASTACSASVSPPSHPSSGPASPTSLDTTPKRASASRTASTCQADQLLARLPSNYLEASNEFEQPVVVENRSRTPCRLGGWPELTVLSPAGHPIPTTNEFLRRYNPSFPVWPTVPLGPGGTASFAVSGEGSNAADNRACPLSSSWRIDLPSVERPFRVAARRPACEGPRGISLEVTPLLPGLPMKRFQDFSQLAGSATCDERCRHTDSVP